jgi:hypothetical protein
MAKEKKERAAAALDKMEEKAPRKEKARFFHDLAPIRSGIHMKAPRKDAEDERLMTLMFRVALNGNLVRSAPACVQTAFEGVSDHDEDLVSISQLIENVNIAIFETDRSKGSSLELNDVTISKLEVKEIRSGKGDPSIVLTFQVEYPAEREVWAFMRTHYAGDVFLVFDSAQASLLNLVDAKESEKDDRHPDLIPPSGKDQAAGVEAEG